MRDLLSSGGVGLVLLGEAQRIILDLKSALATQDLRSDEGIGSALAIQGEIKGVNRMIDLMFEIAEKEE